MARVKQISQAQSPDNGKLVDIEITKNARLAGKKGPQNIEHEETDIM